jgi:hypothetical protein
MMIETAVDFGTLAARLTAKAGELARARAVLMARRRDGRRWRTASLLWPLFGQE